jgi:hypothetical protein
MNYYPINEKAARLAHEMNSFRPFTEGRTTAEYQSQVDAAAEMAAERKERVDPTYHGKIDGLLDAYARKLAEWYNKGFNIDSRCPSVMISGASNFPVRRKEKQNAARERHHKDYQAISGLLDRIQALGTGGISSDDPEALNKLKEKLAGLERNHEYMKAVNVYYRKHKTLDGCPGLDENIRQDLERYSHLGFIPTYKLSYNLAEIKRVKQRITELERLAERPPQGWKFGGGEVVVNNGENRLQILFDGKPNEEMRRTLKSRGFRWAPTQGAWQRQLTNNAIYAAKEVLRGMAG